MTAGLPGLRTVPSPLAPRLQAGTDLHVHTTHSDGLCREVHLLGHFLGDDDSSLLAVLGWLRAGRGPRLQAMAEKLRDHDLVLDLERLHRARPANPSSDTLAESLKF